MDAVPIFHLQLHDSLPGLWPKCLTRQPENRKTSELIDVENTVPSVLSRSLFLIHRHQQDLVWTCSSHRRSARQCPDTGQRARYQEEGMPERQDTHCRKQGHSRMSLRGMHDNGGVTIYKQGCTASTNNSQQWLSPLQMHQQASCSVNKVECW